LGIETMEAIMPREWLIQHRDLDYRRRADAFADPLDRAEWQGLGWMIWLMRRPPAIRPEKPISTGRAGVQTRTPLLTR
jgi:hypothetical protein